MDYNMTNCKDFFLLSLSTMKQILDLLAFKFDKESDDYKYFKKEVMNYFYNGLKTFYVKAEKSGLIKRCPCNANLRKGYKECACGGCGYIEVVKDK